jgi:hypothetical protein
MGNFGCHRRLDRRLREETGPWHTGNLGHLYEALILKPGEGSALQNACLYFVWEIRNRFAWQVAD